MGLHKLHLRICNRVLACVFAALCLTACISEQERALQQVDPAVIEAFQKQMLQAVDEKKIYPKVAILNREQGIVVVSFDYTDGNKASNVKISRTKSSNVLNNAAIKAVEDADLPAKPSGLEKVKHFTVSIRFMLTP